MSNATDLQWPWTPLVGRPVTSPACCNRHLLGPLVPTQVANRPWVHDEGWPAIRQPGVDVVGLRAGVEVVCGA